MASSVFLSATAVFVVNFIDGSETRDATELAFLKPSSSIHRPRHSLIAQNPALQGFNTRGHCVQLWSENDKLFSERGNRIFCFFFCFDYNRMRRVRNNLKPTKYAWCGFSRVKAAHVNATFNVIYSKTNYLFWIRRLMYTIVLRQDNVHYIPKSMHNLANWLCHFYRLFVFNFYRLHFVVDFLNI